MRLSKQIKYRDNLVKFIADKDSKFTFVEVGKIHNEINLMTNLIKMQESNLFKTVGESKQKVWLGKVKQSKMNSLVDHSEKSQNL